MPAILAEVSCLSNEKDAELLATGPYRQGIAEALRTGIETNTLDLTHTTRAAGAPPESAPAEAPPAATAATGSPT
jgi:hypothetical protein